MVALSGVARHSGARLVHVVGSAPPASVHGVQVASRRAQVVLTEGAEGAGSKAWVKRSAAAGARPVQVAVSALHVAGQSVAHRVDSSRGGGVDSGPGRRRLEDGVVDEASRVVLGGRCSRRHGAGSYGSPG
jgi:hypothetical protein